MGKSHADFCLGSVFCANHRGFTSKLDGMLTPGMPMLYINITYGQHIINLHVNRMWCKSHATVCLGTISQKVELLQNQVSVDTKKLVECFIHHRTEYRLRNGAIGVNLVAEFD